MTASTLLSGMAFTKFAHKTEVDLVTRRAYITEVVAIMEESYGWPQFPGRPALLTDNPEHLIGAYEAEQRSDQVAADTKRMLRTFGAWRGAVLTLEGQAQGRLLVLIFAARLCEVDGAAEIADQQIAIHSFVYGHYGVEFPPVPSKEDQQAYVTRVCRNTELMPRWMRTLKRPRQQTPSASNHND